MLASIGRKCEPKFETGPSLSEMPQFIRFDLVELDYIDHDNCSRLIEEKCQLDVNYLKPLKKALNDSRMIPFNGYISDIARGDAFNNNQSQLISQRQKELLPICRYPRGCYFRIGLNPKEKPEQV